MNHIKTRTGKRWWWVALVCTVVVVVSIPLSFWWGINWWVDSPATNTWWTIKHGFFVFVTGPPPMVPGLASITDVSWYGNIAVFDSSHDDIRWYFLPDFYFTNINSFSFMLPMYILLVVLIPYLMLPFVKKRHCRKLGLCVKCAYDLTGNESGTCPECGTEIKP